MFEVVAVRLAGGIESLALQTSSLPLSKPHPGDAAEICVCVAVGAASAELAGSDDRDI